MVLEALANQVISNYNDLNSFSSKANHRQKFNKLLLG